MTIAAGAIATTTTATIDRGVNVMGGVPRSQSARSGRRTTNTWNAMVIGIPRSRYASALRRNANPRAMYPPMTRVATTARARRRSTATAGIHRLS